MKYNFNGKQINIPDKEIKKSMELLELTEEEAIEMWLEDEGYLDNEEQIELTQKAKESGILSTIHGAKAENVEKKEKKPKTVKISEEKQELFKAILENLQENFENVEVLNPNKLISIKINGKTFKLDLIEQRKPKGEKPKATVTHEDVLHERCLELESKLRGDY